MSPDSTGDDHVCFMLPEGIDPSIFRGHGERPAGLAYVAHLLTTEPMRESGFVAINKELLRKRISKRAEKEAFEILRDFIEIDHNYSPRKRSKGYRWKLPFRDQKCVPHCFRCPRLILKLDSLTEAHRSSYGPLESVLESVLGEVSLDIPEPSLFVHTLPPKQGVFSEAHRRNVILNSIYQIQNKDIGVIKRSPNTGRLHCLVNRTSSFIRPLLKIDDLPVTELDLASSQPYFLATLFPSRELREAVSHGQFYERINEEMSEPVSFLDPFAYGEFKQAVLAALYARPKHGFIYWEDEYSKSGKLIGAMERAFSGITDFTSSYRERHGETALPVALQKAESEIFISTILPKLQAESIPAIPIHDGILCLESQSKKVEEQMREDLERKTNLVPMIRGKK